MSQAGTSPRRRWRWPLGRAATIALALLVVVTLAAVFAPVVTRFDPAAKDVRNRFAGPSTTHLLGTDNLGRDLFSRLLHGARISLRVSVTTVFGALLAAIPLGLAAGYFGGRFDRVVMRLIESLLSIPPLVMAIAVIAVLGPDADHLAIAIGVILMPGFARLIRASARSVREEKFIEASRSMGTPTARILLVRVLPNVRHEIITRASFSLGFVLIIEAALSFLGLGDPPPAASWGVMLRNAYDTALFTHPYQLVVPGAAIVLVVLAFNVIGDGLTCSQPTSAGPAFGRLRRRRYGITTVASATPEPPRSSTNAPPCSEPHPSSDRQPETDRRSPLLSVSGLSVEMVGPSGPVRVIDDISLEIDAGEVVGVVGESGSGKTVTALSIMRLLPSPPARIVAGEICFDGHDLLRASAAQMRRLRGKQIAMVFQDPMTTLNPAYTVGNQIVEAIRLHDDVPRRQARAHARTLLDRVGIADAERRLDAYPHHLSGGMRQRVTIAMAIAAKPRLLLADEPTTALDVTVQSQIVDLLREVQREYGMALMFVTHDLGVIADIADRVLVMYAGQLVEQAEVGEIFARPLHPYSTGLLNASRHRTVDDRLISMPGRVPAPGSISAACRFHPRCLHAIAACQQGTPQLVGTSASASAARCIRLDELSRSVEAS